MILRRSAASALAEKFVADRDSAVTERFVVRTVERLDRVQEQRYAAGLAARGLFPVPASAGGDSGPPVTLALLSGGAAAFAARAGSDLPLPVVQRRKQRLARELEAFTLLTAADDGARDVAGQGRVSGDQEWVASRGEGGAAVDTGPAAVAVAVAATPARTYVCPAGAAAPAPPAWLIPGVVVSTSVLDASSGGRYVDVSAASFGFDACRQAPREPSAAAASLGPVFATREEGTFVGALCTSLKARGRAATLMSLTGAMTATRCILDGSNVEADSGAGTGGVVVVTTGDALLICNKNQTGKVGEVVEKLKVEGKTELL